MEKNNYLYPLITFLFSAFMLDVYATTSGVKETLKLSSAISEIIIAFQHLGNNNIFYYLFFSSTLVLFLYNLFFCLILKAKSYVIFLGVIFFWTFSSLLWLKLSHFSFSAIVTTILYLFFIKDLLDLKEKDPKLNKLSNNFFIILRQ